ncbi:MAG: hypothetical protein AB2595_02930 [Candidatus Thiodiazotropha endolucinida]
MGVAEFDGCPGIHPPITIFLSGLIAAIVDPQPGLVGLYIGYTLPTGAIFTTKGIARLIKSSRREDEIEIEEIEELNVTNLQKAIEGVKGYFVKILLTRNIIVCDYLLNNF